MLTIFGRLKIKWHLNIIVQCLPLLLKDATTAICDLGSQGNDLIFKKAIVGLNRLLNGLKGGSDEDSLDNSLPFKAPQRLGNQQDTGGNLSLLARGKKRKRQSCSDCENANMNGAGHRANSKKCPIQIERSKTSDVDAPIVE